MSQNSEFEYKELDQEGLDTLNVIEKADKFNFWMYSTIKPFCKGEVLEIGSGIGNISSFFFKDNYSITLSDIRDNYCASLESKFKKEKTLKGVVKMDLVDENFETKFEKYLGTFDTIFALNVVEHIENDQLAIANCKKLLRKDGNLIILVPAYNALYNNFDKELFHYRRYTKATLSKLFIVNNLPIIHKQYFNLAGILGWFVSGSILKNKTLPGGQMSLYNKLVPIFKIADKVIFNKIGLSVIVVGKK